MNDRTRKKRGNKERGNRATFKENLERAQPMLLLYYNSILAI
jgi:hypothetical protein